METEYTEYNKFKLPNIVIPLDVLANKNLSPREMILFGYITDPAYNEQGYCNLSNRYLSVLLNTTPTTVSRMISNLIKEQYLYAEYIERPDGNQERRIYINKKHNEA